MNKRILLLILIFVLLAALFLAWRNPFQKPPVQEITEARQQLAKAKLMHADKYAPALFTTAQTYYDSAMFQWNHENQKWSLFGNYESVKNYAGKANHIAQEAIDRTEKNYANAADILDARIIMVERKINAFQNNYGKFPFNRIDSKVFVSSKWLLKESKLAYQQSNFERCKSKIDSAETIINALNERYTDIITSYFERHDEWEQDVQETIHHSRKHKSYAIIVDKYARTCMLYKNGQLQQTFPCELGPNWIGDKNYQGDQSTPEGKYKVVDKRSNGSTIYYKAFLLDYPNEDDKKRFTLNKKNGTIKKDADIGGLIEIHGKGGKGIDWTNGCVALKNEDMDKLYAACPDGTWVTIVGSVKPLNDIERHHHE